MSTALTPFAFPETGQPVRTVVIDDEPWFVGKDACDILGIANVGNALARLDADERSSIRLTDGTSGNPNRAIVNEPGLYTLILRSDKSEARTFKRWITHEVLPSLRRTGRYEVTPQELTNRDLARMVIEEADRADRAESFRVAIEGGDGLTVRSFHKKYFSDVSERVFFEHLYSHGLLLNQRGKGSEREDGTRRDGSQHRHPSYKGKQYFYLHSGGVFGDKRRETSRVRPGAHELELKALLIAQGLPANNNQCGPQAIEGPTQTALSLDEAGAA